MCFRARRARQESCCTGDQIVDAFEWFLRDVVGTKDIDVMLEAKGKDVALTTLRRQLAAKPFD
jgi:hypothetical protein